EGCEAAAGFFPWIEVREATEIKIGVKMRRLFVFLNDGAPVISRFEQRIGGGVVGRAAPRCARIWGSFPHVSEPGWPGSGIVLNFQTGSPFERRNAPTQPFADHSAPAVPMTM